MARLITAEMARLNSEIAQEKAQEAGITEPCMTWSDWYDHGFLVKREERTRPVFRAEVYPKYTDGRKYLMDFFSGSQVSPARGRIQKEVL